MLHWLRIALVTDPLALLWLTAMGFGTVVANMLDRRGDLGHRVAAFLSRCLFVTSGVPARVTGKKNVPRGGAFVVVVNHESMLDIPALMARLPVSFRFLAKESLYGAPFIGWHLKLGGHIRVDREDKRAAVKVMAEARRLLEQGTPVVVFAEGSRSRSGLQAFKGGAAHLAIRAGVPVLPVGLTGTGDALPRGSIHIRPRPISVRIGELIPTAGLGKQDSGELTSRLHESVAALISAPTPEPA